VLSATSYLSGQTGCTPRCVILMIVAYLAQASPLLADDTGPSPDFKQSAQLDRMTPSGKYLRRGRSTIIVDFTVHAISSESIEYVGILTFNGTPYSPLTFVLTPGEITIKTNMRWQVSTSGQQASVRFRLIGIGNTTKTGYEFVDITKYYAVVKPVSRPTRRCLVFCWHV
jgi:hypothetical protein